MTSRARRRDRRVYLRSHPILFMMLAIARRRTVLRLGSTVIVNGTDEYREALTRLPIDRTAKGTTGGSADLLSQGRQLFNEDHAGHRESRRAAAQLFGSDGVARVRPLWVEVLRRRSAPLARGKAIDVVAATREVAGVTAAALLGLPGGGEALAVVAGDAASRTIRDEILSLGRRGPRRSTRAAVARLFGMVNASTLDQGMAGVTAIAATTTMMAALPRAVAWCADEGLWGHAADPGTRDALVDELLRVIAPTPMLPRAAAADGTIGRCPVHQGDRLFLVNRHAAESYRIGPDPENPRPSRVSHLIFGAGPHTCPGALLARTQLADALAMLAPYRPVVVRARADRRAAFPGWAALRLRAGTA